MIDPSSGLDDECDVLIEDGRIAEIGRDLDGQEAFDCTGTVYTTRRYSKTIVDRLV